VFEPEYEEPEKKESPEETIAVSPGKKKTIEEFEEW
jgi:hypothetical protein